MLSLYFDKDCASIINSYLAEIYIDIRKIKRNLYLIYLFHIYNSKVYFKCKYEFKVVLHDLNSDIFNIRMDRYKIGNIKILINKDINLYLVICDQSYEYYNDKTHHRYKYVFGTSLYHIQKYYEINIPLYESPIFKTKENELSNVDYLNTRLVNKYNRKYTYKQIYNTEMSEECYKSISYYK